MMPRAAGRKKLQDAGGEVGAVEHFGDERQIQLHNLVMALEAC